MSFITDKQTLDDLNILGKYKSNSIFHIFNKTNTEGGERILEKMFLSPQNDIHEINRRESVFKAFISKPVTFSFDSELIKSAEFYLSFPMGSTLSANILRMFGARVKTCIAADENYNNLKRGLADTINLFRQLKAFYDEHSAQYASSNVYIFDEIKKAVNENMFLFLVKLPADYRDIPFSLLSDLHYKLHVKQADSVRQLFDLIYYLDVYISVSNLAIERKFNCATVYDVTEKESFLDCVGLFHPAIRYAKSNFIELTAEQNALFLTGANMAGKSTYMKSLGIAVYLAHMGFPVPAERMELTLMDGLYTSINVSDNLNLGYSHFYAEVKRVKFIAEQVCKKLNLLIIFDELFKGTNVKDAYDATLEVVKAFSLHKNCKYVVSTHIIEVGEELQKESTNFKYFYFPTVMRENVPRYTYQLKEGITSDRQGMMIIRNERIIEIINQNCN